MSKCGSVFPGQLISSHSLGSCNVKIRFDVTKW